jgi:glucuronoarabinoxylan endo-1,4-beta-xylanase
MRKLHKRMSTLALIGLGLLPCSQNLTANAADVTVNVASVKQEIDGFGASSAWCGTVPSSVMNVLYGDLGFSILRLRIEEGINDNWKSGPYTSWAPELANAKAAKAKGAIVFASPWNPPASLRLNGGGGKYSTDPSKWASYRDYLNAYVKYMKDNGVDLHAISIQNEPDYSKDWTYWSATQVHDFVLNYGATINTKLISAEAFQYNKSLFDQILNDSKALENVDIIGTHLYGTSVNNFAYPLFESKGRPAGKKVWMTEHYIGEKETDQGPANTTAIGKEIHDCMVTGNMSGYTYWWITWPNGLATGSGTIYQRAYAIGQFSKYIRPGYFRVDATATPATNVYVSAYSGGGKIVIVAVNTGTGAVTQKFTVQGGAVAQFANYQTASGKNMVAGAAIAVSGGSFTTSLPAQSITTFVGTNTTVSVQSRANDLAANLKLSHRDGAYWVGSLGQEAGTLRVVDVDGREVEARQIPSGSAQTRLQTTKSGVYLIEVKQGAVSGTASIAIP